MLAPSDHGPRDEGAPPSASVAELQWRAMHEGIVIRGRAARAGIYRYPGHFYGRPDLHSVNIYRSREEVLSEAALATFAGKPVTLDHPPGGRGLTPANFQQCVVGHVRSAFADEEFVGVWLVIRDPRAVAAIMTGRAQELSVSYLHDDIGGPGTAPDGTPYIARQERIRAQHVALVAKGHAGPQCRLL